MVVLCDNCKNVINKYPPKSKNNMFGWMCTNICPGQSISSKEVPDNEIQQENAIYKRRHTVQFIIENDNEDIAKRRTTQASILKPLKSANENKYGFIIPPNRSPIKLLLVFPCFDACADALKRAAEKLSFDITYSVCYDNALEEFQNFHHDLIIIDSRFPKLLDYDTLCRSIRNTKGSQHIVVTSLVKKSSYEKEDVLIISQLESGFNRCLVESVNIVTWTNELMQLKTNDCKTTGQLSILEIFYSAFSISKDPIIVTDDSCRMQYLNGACEKLLGFRQDETLGKTINEQLAYDVSQFNIMTNQLSRGKTWQGNVTFKRKLLDNLTVSCRSMPISCAGRTPTHFLIIIDLPTQVDPTMLSQPRGSIHSLRKGSIDIKTIGTDYYRRTSLAKLPLEAPITKVLSLISEIHEMVPSNLTVRLHLDHIVELLKCTELYSPSIKEDNRNVQEETVTSNLIGALLSGTNLPQHSTNSRRSSNDSSILRVFKTGNRVKSSPKSHLDRLLEQSLTWDLNMFKLEKLSDRHPLLCLGMNLFLHFDIATTLNCEENTLYHWLHKIETNYHTSNVYHNSSHAADVMQAVACFLVKDRMKSIMDPMDEASALIAAAAHDIDHPGKTSAFLANSDNSLAILYNDITILESHHAALTFKLTLENDKHNIFKNMDRESYKLIRYNIIDMILATEMTKHFEHLAKFVNVFCSRNMHDEDLSGDYVQLASPENITLVKRIMIKCADVSNPTRPLNICVEWARRIAEEYFEQTDEELKQGLPVVMPMFDRATCSIPKSQEGFIDFIITDMIDAWNAFIDMPELVINMRRNYLKWKEFTEQGFSTLSDISKLQETSYECKVHV